MPVVLRSKGYKFRFYEADLDEPPHVHVEKDGIVAKFWLLPVRCARAGRFRAIEQREIERILLDNQEFLLDSWAKEKAKRANN
jgi:hypothetical protein